MAKRKTNAELVKTWKEAKWGTVRYKKALKELGRRKKAGEI